MDIRMPEMDGLAATRVIAADPALEEVRVVVLTTFELDEYVFEAMRSGASGFLVKHTEPAELVFPSHGVNDNGRRFLQELPTRRRRLRRVSASITHGPDPWRDRRLVDGSRDLLEVIEDVARLGARLMIQTAVEAEVDVFLGRARYQRAAECPDPGGRSYRLLRVDDRDHGRAGNGGTAEAAWHHRGVRLDAVRPRDEVGRVGVAGDRRVRARPVGARCGGHSGRRARRGGGAVQVDGLTGVPGDRR